MRSASCTTTRTPSQGHGISGCSCRATVCRAIWRSETANMSFAYLRRHRDVMMHVGCCTRKSRTHHVKAHSCKSAGSKAAYRKDGDDGREIRPPQFQNMRLDPQQDNEFREPWASQVLRYVVIGHAAPSLARVHTTQWLSHHSLCNSSSVAEVWSTSHITS